MSSFSLLWNNATFWHDPYPVGLIKPVMHDDQYQTLVDNYPPEEFFMHMGGAYHKFSWSEVNHPESYQHFIAHSPIWKAFHSYIKDPLFIDEVFATLRSHNVHLKREDGFKYRSRFEFSSIPADGGYIWPHTDIPTKVVTLVMSMQSGSWDVAFGGGTDILRPKVLGNYADYQTPLEKFEIVRTFQYQPNQCVFFVKTNNSWHSVGPFTGPSGGPMRRTLTINIERFALK